MSSSSEAGRRDFLVSFNAADRAWAEWIAAELEASGYTTFFQHWDFRPGSNFVLEMHKAAALADRTIAVLSPDYLSALFTQPEWAASVVQDPTGAERRLIPIRVQPCAPEGLLKPIVYADLVGLSEIDARARLLAAVSDDRPKPASVPFPSSSAKPFPGSAPSPRPRSDRKPAPADSSDHLKLYAALSLVCFLFGVGLLFLMLWKAETLAAFGLTGRLFYVVLIPIGLAAAGFLFGVMQSVAAYRGKSFGGTVVLGGPIIAAMLVVWGGFNLPTPESSAFSMTVFVHGPGGRQDVLLRRQGSVVMDLGGNRRSEAIDEKGAAHFVGIPAAFRGQDVPVSLEAKGFERADGDSRRLTGESLYLPVLKRAGRLEGIIMDEQGGPVVGAEIDVGGFLAKTDAAGRFDMTITGDRMRQEMTLDVRAPGFQPDSLPVTPGANEIRHHLKRRSK